MRRGQQTTERLLQAGLRLTPQLSARETIHQSTCVVGILTQTELSKIDEPMISQQQQKKSSLISKEGIYNRKSGERMLGQDNPLSDGRNCWHSFLTERRFEMNPGKSQKSNIAAADLHHGNSKQTQLG